MARDVEVPAGGEVTLLWLLGDAGSPEEASALVEKHRDRDFSRAARRDREGMARLPGDAAGRNAGQRVRRDGQSLAALPERRLPYPRAFGLLPGERRFRLPRPAAGHAGAPAARSDAGARPDPERRAAAVPGRRRAALVAAAHRRRRAHDDLGRRGVAGLCRAPLRARDRRRHHPDRAGALHRGRCAGSPASTTPSSRPR